MNKLLSLVGLRVTWAAAALFVAAGILVYADAFNGASKSSTLGNNYGSAEMLQAVNPLPSQPLVFPAAQNLPDHTVYLSAVGDLMFDRTVRTRMEKFGSDYPLANVVSNGGHPFGSVDLLIGNLEGAVSPRRAPVKSIDFSFSNTIPMLLKQHGFTAVSGANNHGLDQGRAGYADTKQALQEANVGFFGDPVNDATGPWVTTVNGTRVALFGYNITDNPLDEAVAMEHVSASAKEPGITVVFMHWGTEYAPQPAAAVRALGRRFIEHGATVVIGAHPHVMEGMELWRGHPIFWSLGNFVFDQDWSIETQHGLAITLGVNGSHFSAELYPIIINKSQPTLATGEARAGFLATFAERSNLSPDLLTQARNGHLEWTSAAE